MSRLSVILLSGLATLLAATLALELTAAPPHDIAPAPAVRVATAAGAGVRPPASAASSEALARTLLARPLFEPGRRPHSVVVAHSAPAAVNVPRVTGVLVGPLDRSAIFAAVEGAHPLVAREGSRVGAFTVQSIRIGQVTLVGPDGPVVVRPSFDPDQRVQRPPATPAPPPAPQAPSMTAIPGLPALPPGPVGKFGLPALPGLPAPPPASDPPR